MNMVFPVGTFEHTGNQVVIKGHVFFADRAFSRYIVFQTAKTAFYIHQAVFGSVSRKGKRFNQIAPVQLYRTNRAYLRIAGFSLQFLLLFPEEKRIERRYFSKEQVIAYPKQNNANNYKNQNLKFIHIISF